MVYVSLGESYVLTPLPVVPVVRVVNAPTFWITALSV
jgi:hypothetical protein